MTSAILVIKYMPDICLNCPLSDYSNQGRPFCKAKKIHLDSFMYKPDWCPLKELPKKEVNSGSPYDEYGDGYTDGWNGCLDEILGE